MVQSSKRLKKEAAYLHKRLRQNFTEIVITRGLRLSEEQVVMAGLKLSYVMVEGWFLYENLSNHLKGEGIYFLKKNVCINSVNIVLTIPTIFVRVEQF